MMPQRILVCDHERHVVAMLRANLERLGWEVTSTYTGASALTKIIEEKHETMILGSGMTDISGQEITRLVRRNPSTRQSFVLLLLDLADPELVFQSYQDGADLVLTKPFDVRQLSSLIPQ
jgi:DNA-binding response OmpR family regulator